MLDQSIDEYSATWLIGMDGSVIVINIDTAILKYRIENTQISIAQTSDSVLRPPY